MNQFANALKLKGVNYQIIDDLDIYGNSKFGKKYLRWITTPKKIQNIIDEFKPDLILTERVSHFSSLITKMDIPLIIFLRGNYWHEIELGKQTLDKSKIKQFELSAKEKIAHKCFSKSAMILPICKHLEKITKEKYPENKIQVFYQGINEEDWFLEKGDIKLKHPSIGFIQNANVWDKCKELLILPKILDALPKVNFYLVGDGPFMEKILPSLEKYDNFHWLGSLEYPNKVREFLTEIDVYGLLSGMDMSPHTILEASIMKKPVLATNVGGIPESIQNEKTGYLIEEGNYDEWIKKINELIEDKEKINQMGINGYDFIINNFLWEQIANEFLEIIKKNNIYF
jgi:glycosyltransferase involved in cell wall biosynthesis